jgi:hypothetical protein
MPEGHSQRRVSDDSKSQTRLLETTHVDDRAARATGAPRRCSYNRAMSHVERPSGDFRLMRLMTVVVAVGVTTGGCFPRGPAIEGDADPTFCEAGDTFEDHTHIGAFDVETFMHFAMPNGTATAVDFIVVDVTDATRRHVRFEDASFYAFHDEWSWFRLLNGVPACGSTADPEPIGPFASIDEIYAFLDGESELPLDLSRTLEGRLVSPGFYTLALRTTPRVYATGTLFRFAHDRGDRYVFELAFVDAVTHDDLTLIHAELEAAVPDDDPVYWRALSADQIALARSIERDAGDPLRARMLMPGASPPVR